MNNYQIASLLKQLRNNYNFTIQKVAYLLGVSKAAVSKWENGDDITTEHLYDLSKLYNVSFTELCCGKLNNEDNSAYWKRNYDLSNYEIDEDISNRNIDTIKSLFEHCAMVKKRFYELLPNWANEELTENELEEFNFIKKYFKFDAEYYVYIKYGPGHLAFATPENEKEFTLEILDKISDLDEKSYMWELTKLFDFIYDYQSDKVHDSRSLKALEYMLSSLNQIEKDYLLDINLHVEVEVKEDHRDAFMGISTYKKNRDMTIKEIEEIPYFKVMINSGANVLYRHKSRFNFWDLEMVKQIEGKTREIDDSILDNYQFYNIAGQQLNPILHSWKIYSYSDYLNNIDYDTTEYLRDIVNLKDSNPIKYYENLERRNRI